MELLVLQVGCVFVSIKKDFYVIVPNALGVLASIIQIAIFIIYRQKQKNKTQTEETTKE